MFNCRELDLAHSVLIVDYSVDCNEAEHSAGQVVAGVMIAVFALGIPVGMGIMMLRRMREYSASSDSDRFVARRAADELKMDDVEAEDVIRDVTTGREYSFLVNAYK